MHGQCDAVNGLAVNNTWTLRASLLTYFMALTATIGKCQGHIGALSSSHAPVDFPYLGSCSSADRVAVVPGVCRGGFRGAADGSGAVMVGPAPCHNTQVGVHHACNGDGTQGQERQGQLCLFPCSRMTLLCRTRHLTLRSSRHLMAQRPHTRTLHAGQGGCSEGGGPRGGQGAAVALAAAEAQPDDGAAGGGAREAGLRLPSGVHLKSAFHAASFQQM